MPPDAFASLTTALDPAMVVVTTASGGERSGCMVGFHAQAAIDPPRYAVWLSKANHTYPVALQATHLAVHLLTDGDRELAELFGGRSGDEVDKFAVVAHHPGPGGVPLLSDCPHRLVLRRTVLFDDGGDHVCMVGEPVEAVTAGPLRPLRLSQVQDLTPGHGADERAPLTP
jgi:flavin reductase (DIM6/NTAB) family NADH-FMN oxidoreductase RutF